MRLLRTLIVPSLAMAAALVAGLVAGLVAATPPASAQTVRGVTDTEILIGTYTDLSGVTASWGVNNSNAYRMAFDEVNAEGGINGRKIRYIVEDNQYQVPRSVQAANKLINRDGVFLLVGDGGTPMNNAVLPEQLAKGVPNMFPLTSARSMYMPFNRLKYGLASSYYDQMRAGVKLFVEKRGKKRICAMSQDTDFGRDVMDGARDQLKAMNISLVAETQHKPTDTDFSAAAEKLHDANCDLILTGTIVRDSIQAIAAVRKLGWNVDMLGQVASYDSAVAQAPGGVTDGFYSMTSLLLDYQDDPNPAAQAFIKKYHALFGKDPNLAAQIGYTGAQLLILGLQRAGRALTVDSFVTGMDGIKDYQDIFGSPKMSYGPDRRQGSTESFLAVVKDGRWVPVSTQPVGY